MKFWIRGLLGAALLAAPLAQATAVPAPVTAAPAAPAPAAPPVTGPAAADLPRLGETWVLRGRSDRGAALEKRLTLRPLSEEARRNFEESAGKTGTTLTAIQAAFGLGEGPQGEETGILAVLKVGEGVQVLQVAPGIGDLDAPFFMCFLARQGEAFSGISLRLREAGESYAVSGVTPLTGDGPVTDLDVVRVVGQSLAPLFGTGDCRLSRN